MATSRGSIITETEAKRTASVLSLLLMKCTKDKGLLESIAGNRKMLSFYGNAILEVSRISYETEENTESAFDGASYDFKWKDMHYIQIPKGAGIIGIIDELVSRGSEESFRGLPMGAGFVEGDARIEEMLSLGRVFEHAGYRSVGISRGKYGGEIRVYEAGALDVLANDAILHPDKS